MISPPTNTFKWILQPLYEPLAGASDEFLAGEFRIRLMGNSLEVTFEGTGPCSPEAARALAEKYIAALKMPVFLITEEEFLKRTTPPFGGVMRTLSINREGRRQAERAVREARNELLASANEALRRCYNYLQDAHERLYTGEDAAYAVYKAMEVLEERFGGEAKAIAALGKTLKEAKKAANEERHIPEKVKPQANASGRSVGLAREVIRAYERYLLGRQQAIQALLCVIAFRLASE